MKYWIAMAASAALWFVLPVEAHARERLVTFCEAELYESSGALVARKFSPVVSASDHDVLVEEWRSKAVPNLESTNSAFLDGRGTVKANCWPLIDDVKLVSDARKMRMNATRASGAVEAKMDFSPTSAAAAAKPEERQKTAISEPTPSEARESVSTVDRKPRSKPARPADPDEMPGKPLRFMLYVPINHVINGNNAVCYSNVVMLPGPAGWNIKGAWGARGRAMEAIEPYKAGFLQKCRAKGYGVRDGSLSVVWNDEAAANYGPNAPEQKRGELGGRGLAVSIS